MVKKKKQKSSLNFERLRSFKNIQNLNKFRLVQLGLLLSCVWFFYWSFIWETVNWSKSLPEAMTISFQNGNLIFFLISVMAVVAAEPIIRTQKTDAEKGSTMEKLKAWTGKFKKKPVPKPPTVIYKTPPEDAQIIETYPIQPPFSQVTIATLPELGGGKAYYIEELRLLDGEKEILQTLTDIISKEIEPPEDQVEPAKHLEIEAKRLAKKYGLEKKIPPETWPKLKYYLQRDLIGFGPIHVIMNDRMIEDISVNGVGIPLYAWHRKYESMPTNLVFVDEDTLDNLIIKLTHLAQKHISTAFPVLDAMLPGKDRLAATFRREVSPKGGSFTIRRFREEPFSVIDLNQLGTLDEEIAAYFWLLIENRMTVAVIGGTAAGKTSTLNALASLIKPAMKIVTVEEIPELNLPHENWVQLVSRESYGLGAMKTGEVTLFDLVRTSLRYRPDYIVVGEIRGAEAFVLFQALATGHGGMTTLHAENLDYAVKRLTSQPMNVAKTYISLINVAAIQERVQLPNPTGDVTFGRRLKSVVELTYDGDYRTIATWDPTKDRYQIDLKNSLHLEKIALNHGVSTHAVLKEVQKRIRLLKSLQREGVTKNVDVAKFITNYYLEAPALQIKVKPKNVGKNRG